MAQRVTPASEMAAKKAKARASLKAVQPEPVKRTTRRPQLPLLDRQGAAEQLGVSVTSVDRYVSQGLLPFRRMGGLTRFAPEDIQAFIKSGYRIRRRRRAA